MTGYEVATRLRSEPGLMDAVLVALTGWGSEADKLKSQEAGFDYHLTKPADAVAIEGILAQTATRGSGNDAADEPP